MRVDASSPNLLTAAVFNKSETQTVKQTAQINTQATDTVSISSEAAALYQQSISGEGDKGDKGVVTPMNGGGTEPPLPPPPPPEKEPEPK